MLSPEQLQSSRGERSSVSPQRSQPSGGEWSLVLPERLQPSCGERFLLSSERSEELSAAGGHQLEVGRGHEEPKALLLEPFHVGRAKRRPAQRFAVLFRCRDDFGHGGVQPAIVLAAAQTERE